MNRRQVLGLGGATAVAGAGGLWGAWRWLPRSPRTPLPSVRELAQELVASVSPETLARLSFPYDHPLRQYHNHGVRGAGLSVSADHFTRNERGILTDLLHAGLSERGRARIPEQFFLSWPGVHLLDVALFGSPDAEFFQLVLSGVHLNLRLGGTNREGVAFGGPQVFGDQRGNERAGLPGNVYRYQLEAARALFESLSRGQREQAFLEASPHQQQLEIRGPSASLPGVAVGELSPASRERATALLDGALATYAPADHEYARACIEGNGGIEALHASWYAEGLTDPHAASQVFRLEGPAAVYYFYGAEHVHGFLNVARDAENPLSVGRLLGTNPARLTGDALRSFFEDALVAATGADGAWYAPDSVVGELRAGPIRTGDLYVLESWQNRTAIVEGRGADFGPELRGRWEGRGLEVDPARTYRVATSDYSAASHTGHLGRLERVETGGSVRDALVAYAEASGFPAA